MKKLLKKRIVLLFLVSCVCVLARTLLVTQGATDPAQVKFKLDLLTKNALLSL
jgi:hypothetical protein